MSAHETGPMPIPRPTALTRRRFLMASPAAAALLIAACSSSDPATPTLPVDEPGIPSTYVLSDADADLTGTDDATAALQSILDTRPDGSEIVIPDGAVLRCTAGLELPGGKHLSGPGELRFTDGIAQASALTVTGSGSRIHRLRMTNPDLLGARSQTGENPFAITIKANNVEISECFIDSFQSGIGVDPYGEWYYTRILNNRIKDVLGAGDGPDDLVSTLGEDRGDGIVTWGAAATIIGNEVDCRAGSDARIGIHCEALKDREQESGPMPNSTYTVANNTVRGQFRRGIVVEDITQATIINNTVSDSTWWGVAVIRSSQVSVADNTIEFTRADTDRQGQSYAPHRAAVMLYGSTTLTAVERNTITVSGHADSYIAMFGVDDADDQPRDCVAINNTGESTAEGVTTVGGSVTLGVACRYERNTFSGFRGDGIAFWHTAAPAARQNTLSRTGDRAHAGIQFENSNDGPTDTTTYENTITGFADGILDTNATAGHLEHRRNRITECTNGINLFDRDGSTGSLDANEFVDVRTETVNVPDGISIS